MTLLWAILAVLLITSDVKIFLWLGYCAGGLAGISFIKIFKSVWPAKRSNKISDNEFKAIYEYLIDSFEKSSYLGDDDNARLKQIGEVTIIIAKMLENEYKKGVRHDRG